MTVQDMISHVLEEAAMKWFSHVVHPYLPSLAVLQVGFYLKNLDCDKEIAYVELACSFAA